MLEVLTEEAGLISLDAFRSSRDEALASVPSVIAYYSDGSAALAADYFGDERDAQGAAGRFVAAPVVLARAEKVRRALLWVVGAEADAEAESRMLTVVQSEVARPFRDTLMLARRNDPECKGYRRVIGDGCQFCRFLSDKGAIFKEDTAYFAAHDNCKCTAQPVFRGGITGPEASVMQYIGSKRKRSKKEKSELRSYLNTYFPR